LPWNLRQEPTGPAVVVSRYREWRLMSNEPEIRPFRVDMPEEAIADLRRRIAATRWPERETVTDDSQGVRLALIQDLARY
jgi:Epoxide hydrolase N terminus